MAAIEKFGCSFTFISNPYILYVNIIITLKKHVFYLLLKLTYYDNENYNEDKCKD